MNKLVILLVLLGIGWFFREPLGDLVDRVKEIPPRVRTEMDMRGYVDGLRAHIEDEGEPPDPLAEWIDERFPPKGAGQLSSEDRYGTPYQVTRNRELGGWQLRSCGPDTRCHTEDDIVVSLAGDRR